MKKLIVGAIISVIATIATIGGVSAEEPPVLPPQNDVWMDVQTHPYTCEQRIVIGGLEIPVHFFDWAEDRARSQLEEWGQDYDPAYISWYLDVGYRTDWNSISSWRVGHRAGEPYPDWRIPEQAGIYPHLDWEMPYDNRRISFSLNTRNWWEDDLRDLRTHQEMYVEIESQRYWFSVDMGYRTDPNHVRTQYSICQIHKLMRHAGLSPEYAHIQRYP